MPNIKLQLERIILQVWNRKIQYSYYRVISAEEVIQKMFYVVNVRQALSIYLNLINFLKNTLKVPVKFQFCL